MADKNTLKNWFKTGLKPTQIQFWAWIDSYWHKEEPIPQSAVQNLQSTLNAKVETSQFNGHLNDVNAHSELELKAKIYKVGQLQIFKTGENTGLEIEAGDLITGIVQNSFIQGVYISGDVTQLTSYNLINQIEF